MIQTIPVKLLLQRKEVDEPHHLRIVVGQRYQYQVNLRSSMHYIYVSDAFVHEEHVDLEEYGEGGEEEAEQLAGEREVEARAPGEVVVEVAGA